jgi:hypothetical protein
LSLWRQIKAFLPGHRAPAKERRRVRRLACKIQAEVRTEKSSFAATITEISVAGIRVEPVERLSNRSNVAVSVPASKKGLVRCRTVWASRLGAGLVFDDTEEAKSLSWLKETLVSSGFSQDNVKERRTQVRVRSGHRAYLTNLSDTTIAEGTLLNIGRGGAMLLTDSEASLGTRCKLNTEASGVLPALAVPAQVLTIRSRPQDRKFHVGLVFEDEDDPMVDKLVSLLFR